MTTQTAPAELRAEQSVAVVYPETDGEPLPDGETQAPLYQEIVPTLAQHFRDRPRTRVNGNTLLYYEEGNPRRHISPDCYVAFDVDVALIEAHNNYRLWAVGKAPDFVLEIGSASTADNDIGGKRALYAALGVGEYWRYDPTGGRFYGEPLAGEYRFEGRYLRYPLHRESDGMVWAHSPALSLDLCWIDGRLRFYHPVTQRWLLNFTETTDLLSAEYVALDAKRDALATERTALAAERAARQTAEARIAQLEAELRRRDASG